MEANNTKAVLLGRRRAKIEWPIKKCVLDQPPLVGAMAAREASKLGVPLLVAGGGGLAAGLLLGLQRCASSLGVNKVSIKDN